MIKFLDKWRQTHEAVADHLGRMRKGFATYVFGNLVDDLPEVTSDLDEVSLALEVEGRKLGVCGQEIALMAGVLCDFLEVQGLEPKRGHLASGRAWVASYERLVAVEREIDPVQAKLAEESEFESPARTRMVELLTKHAEARARERLAWDAFALDLADRFGAVPGQD